MLLEHADPPIAGLDTLFQGIENGPGKAWERQETAALGRRGGRSKSSFARW